MQDRWEAGKVGCRKGRMTGRMDEKKRDEEKEGFRTGRIQDWSNN